MGCGNAGHVSGAREAVIDVGCGNAGHVSGAREADIDVVWVEPFEQGGDAFWEVELD